MKKIIALVLAMLMLFCSCAVAEEWEDVSWIIEDQVLAVYVRTPASEAMSWSASLDEQGLLELIREEFAADEMTMDATDVMGTWVTSWQLIPEAAGIVTIILHCSDGSDAPTASYRLEVYLDGKGSATVLTLNGEEVGLLPVD